MQIYFKINILLTLRSKPDLQHQTNGDRTSYIVIFKLLILPMDVIITP